MEDLRSLTDALGPREYAGSIFELFRKVEIHFKVSALQTEVIPCLLHGPLSLAMIRLNAYIVFSLD